MPVGFKGYQVTEKVMHASERTVEMEGGQSRDAQRVCMHREKYRSSAQGSQLVSSDTHPLEE